MFIFENSTRSTIYKLKIARASAFGGRGHIPLLHPPLLDSQLAMGAYTTIEQPPLTKILATPLCLWPYRFFHNIGREILDMRLHYHCF